MVLTGLRSKGTSPPNASRMIRGPPGTLSILVRSTAGFTPYQQGGTRPAWVIALSETVPPIDPET